MPPKNLNFKPGETAGTLSAWFRKRATDFEAKLRKELTEEVQGNDIFPTSKEIDVTVVFGIPQDEYATSDIDNKIKTVIDALKGPVCNDDSSVRTIYATRIATSNNENWCLIQVKVEH